VYSECNIPFSDDGQHKEHPDVHDKYEDNVEEELANDELAQVQSTINYDE